MDQIKEFPAVFREVEVAMWGKSIISFIFYHSHIHLVHHNCSSISKSDPFFFFFFFSLRLNAWNQYEVYHVCMHGISTSLRNQIVLFYIEYE